MHVFKNPKPQSVDSTKLILDYKAELQKYVEENPSHSYVRLQAVHIQVAEKLIRQVTNNSAQMQELHNLLERNFKLFGEESWMNLNWQGEREEEVAIGIDLGTVNSVTGVYLKGKVQIIPSPLGESNTPSCVAFLKDKEGKMKEVFGKPVQNLQCKDPQNTMHDVKRLIGRKMTDENLHKAIKNMQFSVIDKNGLPQICVSGGSFTPEEISGKLLAEFKRVADKYLKVPIKKAVITVPAYFNDDQRRATQKAGELAGFQVLKLLNEPTAAAIAYKLQRLNERARKVVIFDLGGGTFDVAVLDVGDKIEVQGIGGDPLLGGIDFDVKLMNHCIAKYRQENNCAEIEHLLSTKDEQSRRRRAKFLQACEDVKKQLSFTDTQTLFVNGLINGDDFEVEVTREEFEGLIASDIQKMINIVDKTLKEVNVGKYDVHDIVLVGGSTRIPKLQEMLTNFFPERELNVSIDPDQAVAYGAAMQAALLNGMMIAKDFLNFNGIQDITPMSFGIECYMNGRRGMFSKLITKNSKIPAEGRDVFATKEDDQKNVRIRIFQGDSDQVADNFFLGEFLLSGIPPGRARSQQVDVIMKITPMGIMHVEAVCKTTGSSNSKSLTITRTKSTYDQGRGIENI